MIWRVYFMRTQTGQRGPLIKQSNSAPWTRTLNGADHVEVTLLKEDLKEVEPDWWQPIKGGLLVTLEIDGGEEPFMATIIPDLPAETLTSVTFTGEGVNWLLAYRLALKDEFFNYTDTLPVDQVDKLSKSVLSLVGMSYGTVMQELVKVSTEKVGGQLPIRFGSPRETGLTNRQRNYKGWNLANINTLKLMEELANVIQGPDFMFRPEWADDSHNLVVWTLYHGTHAQPAIHQDWTMSLDTTAPGTGVTNVQVKASKADYANRSYWTGAGEDEGTLIRAAQSMEELSSGVPLVEYVGSTSDSDNPDLIQSRASSYIHNNKYPKAQVTLDFDASDIRYRLDRWQVGDAAEVTIKGWVNMPDGTHTLRIIAASGNVGSNIVSVEFAKEVNDGQEV